MKTSNQIVALLKSIYLVVVSIAVMVIADIVSGGEYDPVCAFLFGLGIVLLCVGLFMGIGAFGSKDQ